ncbi:MAG TPA: PqqD family protein [Pyrinomonadaceae bacterium]|jgi:hypothetical protein|nr:PqqD family protein [Pyrinomonadaceae bacterium]
MAENSNIIWSIVDGEAVLLDTSSGHYFSLNPLATEIWTHLQTGDAVPQIVSTIADKYSVEEEIVRSDISELIGELQAARLWP